MWLNHSETIPLPGPWKNCLPQNLPHQGIKPESPTSSALALAGRFFTASATWKPSHAVPAIYNFLAPARNIGARLLLYMNSQQKVFSIFSTHCQ